MKPFANGLVCIPYSLAPFVEGRWSLIEFSRAWARLSVWLQILTYAMMSTMNAIDAMLDEIVERIRSVADPELIILFGSRGRGDASSESDLDLLIVAESTEPRYLRAIALRRALRGMPVPQDVLVFTPAEMEDWRTAPTSLAATALREGRIIYENRR